MRPGSFSRTLESPCFSGYRAFRLESIRSALASDGKTGLIAADLSLGSWRYHHVATEFCAQLGCQPAFPHSGSRHANGPGETRSSLADIIGEFIDAEGRGDHSIHSALQFTERVAASAGERPRTFAVLLPRFGFDWPRDDVLFVGFLAGALRNSAHRIVLVSTDAAQPKIPGRWNVQWTDIDSAAPEAQSTMLGLVPGLIEPEVFGALSDGLSGEILNGMPLSGNHFLVAPESRRDPASVSRFEFDRLAVICRPFRGLYAYAVYHGNNFYVDPWFLWSQARAECAIGSYGLALRLTERAISCARNPEEAGVLRAFAQGLRIADERFQDAAESSDPSPAVSQQVRGFILESKGWALTMMGNAAKAETYFEAANALLHPNDPGYLYFLNIRALNRLRLGHGDESMRLEMEVEQRHSAMERRDWRLEYVNAINIARLHKYSGNYEAAEKYYARAFNTTAGVREPADCIYANVCRARLNEARGRWSEAFADWMRVALHWVSLSVPEGLRRRIAAAVTGDREKRGPDQISHAIEKSLLQSAVSARDDRIAAVIAEPVSDALPPVFLSSTALAEGEAAAKIEYAVLGPSWSVLLGAFPWVEPLASPGIRRLRGVLSGLIQAQSGASLQRDAIAVLVDDGLGTEMPETPGELLEVCLRWNCPEMVGLGRSMRIGEIEHSELERMLRIEAGAAIAGTAMEQGSVQVFFKRYRPPLTLPAPESEVMAAIVDNPSLSELRARLPDHPPEKELLERLRQMERARVIRLRLPNDICAEKFLHD